MLTQNVGIQKERNENPTLSLRKSNKCVLSRFTHHSVTGSCFPVYLGDCSLLEFHFCIVDVFSDISYLGVLR